MRKLTRKLILEFKMHLVEEEKSKATIEKYIRDIDSFYRWVGNKKLDKLCVLNYKGYLIENYAVASVNSMLSSINSFFTYFEWFELRIKTIKIQKQVFASNDRELTKSEYERLLLIAMKKSNKSLYLLMQTICSTGIRISELRFITVEAVNRGMAEINCKGKYRRVYLPNGLCKILKRYAQENKIKSGTIFVSKNGNPLDRSNVWKAMKNICKEAGVLDKKVFPHNLRHLFARTYYNLQKDVVRLADILGHSNVNTTRIYTMETGEIHRKQIEKLGLLRC